MYEAVVNHFMVVSWRCVAPQTVLVLWGSELSLRLVTGGSRVGGCGWDPSWDPTLAKARLPTTT